jgi:MFS superfamily sulfate permease-like transporter
VGEVAARPWPQIIWGRPHGVRRQISGEGEDDARIPLAGGRCLPLGALRGTGAGDLRADILAGLPGAISSAADGMAAAVLAGVNPVQGLHASFAGPLAGGLTSNTQGAGNLASGFFFRGMPVGDRSARPR